MPYISTERNMSLAAVVKNLDASIHELRSLIFFLKAIQDSDVALPADLFDTDLFLSTIVDNASRLIEETRTNYAQLVKLVDLNHPIDSTAANDSSNG